MKRGFRWFSGYYCGKLGVGHLLGSLCCHCSGCRGCRVTATVARVATGCGAVCAVVAAGGAVATAIATNAKVQSVTERVGSRQ